MADRRRRLSPGAPAAAAALLVAVLGSGVAWAVASAESSARHDREATSAAAALEALDTRAERVVRAVAGPVDALKILPPEQVPALLHVSASPGTAPEIAAGALPDGVSASAVVTDARNAMEVARDTASPQAAPLLGTVVPVAAAEYRGGVDPGSTTARRSNVVGWRIALLSPRATSARLALLTGLAPAGAATGILVQGTPVGTPVRGTTAGTILVAGQPWTLVVATPRAPVSGGAAGVLAITVLGVALCLLTNLGTQRSLRREREAGAALERETRTVAELGPVLQSSLDLAEVLPAVALRLTDEFALSRFGVQLIGESGELVDVFAMGGRGRSGDEERVVVAGVTHELPAGVAGTLPLLRAGRTIGRLTFVGHRPLGQAQLAALSAAADLIGVATYNVELYEREQASVRRLLELDQLKDAFLSTISHELRTPLTAISGFVRLLRDRWGQLREDQRLEFLDRVHGNTLSLGLLVDDLLDFARLERQALNAPPSPVDLDAQVSTILAQLAPVLGARTVASDLLPVRALANAGALERVLANLLTNAAKFSPADSAIAVRVGVVDGAAQLEVADTGAGIAEEDRERVFTRFFRGESDAARGTRGAGIGLSVVRELVAQMGGSVRALPNNPRGTRMVVRLPLADQPVATGPAAPAQRSHT